ncbi:MAG: C4-type zinc ribbon domain-containing protein [bacterium]|nr:C4-type zinc ribbon domain-containing protein [bacterium]
MLETLSEVQDLDLQRDAIAVERGEVPADLLAARDRNAALLRELHVVQHDHELLRRRVATNELDLKALQERRKDASDSALRAATTKEMAQYQNQELQFATRAQELEEDTLPLMEDLERKAGEMAALLAAVSELRPDLESHEAAEQERVSAVELRDAELADRRARLCTEVDAALLRQYEQVRRARRGLALVGLQDGKRCGGCHVQLPIHVVQKVRKGVGVTRCPSCGRLLHQPAAV